MTLSRSRLLPTIVLVSAMKPKNYETELMALDEVIELVRTKPKEAPDLLNAIISEYQSKGQNKSALMARHWQCYAQIANLEYESAKKSVENLISEAIKFGHREFLGYADMNLSTIAIESGDSETALEFIGHAMQIATELADLDLLGQVQMSLAYAQITQERNEDALETLNSCIRFFDAENVTAYRPKAYYNIASVYSRLAIREKLEGRLTEARIDEAQNAIQDALTFSRDDPHMQMLIGVLSTVHTGFSQSPDKGLEELSALESTIKDSFSSYFIRFKVSRCNLLEMAGRWRELCDQSDELIEELIASGGFGCNLIILLRQSARAHAQLGEFEAAYHHLNSSLARAKKGWESKGEDRAKFVSMQQDVERHRFDQDVLRMRNKTLIERNKILELEARYDPLSGLLNRRGTEEALQQYSERRIATRFLIALLDIDHFKRINDKFGHAIGDQVIHEFASCLTHSTSNPAKIGRWGGEEFLIVYDITDDKEMDMIGRTLVEEIRLLNWDHIHTGMRVTASIGLAMWHQGDSVDNAVRIADDMLYEVKHHGRDNWRAWSHDEAA